MTESSDVLDNTPLQIASDFITGLQLLFIQTRGASAKFSSELYQTGVEVRTRINNAVKFEVLEDNCFEVTQDLRVIGRKKTEDPVLIDIRCKIISRYKSKEVISLKTFDHFRKTLLCLQTWPYFREYVQNCTYRAGLPPMIIPFLQVADMSELSKEPFTKDPSER
ncbi:MAG: protein-export chaperone SecB [Candidatus Coatesbacteria bacterium]|nr:protein-export chaperone SecB [Candidatus Coatesbacteria bacterium]